LGAARERSVHERWLGLATGYHALKDAFLTLDVTEDAFSAFRTADPAMLAITRTRPDFGDPESASGTVIHSLSSATPFVGVAR
jgi:hypothetical protein